MKRVFTLLTALLMVFGLKAPVMAEPLLTLQTHSNIEATGVTDHDSVDLFSPGLLPLTHNPRLDAVGSFGSSTLDMDLESSFGRLGARLDARSSVVFVPLEYILARTLTITNLRWTDTFTVLSPTLDPGTPVDIVARLSLTGNVSNAGLTTLIVESPSGPSEVLPRSLQAGLQIGAAGAENIWFDVSSTLREPFTTFNEFGATAFTANVGQSFDILSFLQFETTTLAFSDPGFDFEPISNLLVDASNSARFGIEVLTAGASLDSESGATYPTDPRAILVIPEPVDIKPQSCPNPLNVKSYGVLPVAILGTADFDVTTIDPVSIRLEGVAAIKSALQNVATPFEPFTGKEDAFDCNELGPDGFQDLTLKFRTQEIVEALGDVQDGEALILTLTGNLQDGTTIEGEDVVVILKKGNQGNYSRKGKKGKK